MKQYIIHIVGGVDDEVYNDDTAARARLFDLFVAGAELLRTIEDAHNRVFITVRKEVQA